jgi:SAM-dependent methyltransferase
MKPARTGGKYDKIARWWHDQHHDSEYGLAQIRRAISYARPGPALDVGCGAGGRIVRELTDSGFTVEGIDVSSAMLTIAREQHPELNFTHASITEWQTERRYNLIIAWDSIFHLPLSEHAAVIAKLCRLLAPGGILAYTFGDATGEHESRWHDDDFYYSSIGIDGNLKAIMDAGCTCAHLELDQYPEKHVFMIARKE